MAVTLKGQTAVYEGVSTDTKPTDADNNAIFKELDTGIRYYYDGTDWNKIPSSGGGGGGTGTDNYNELNNKPSINGTVLSGNKSLDNLGIQAKLTFDSAPTEDSENPVESGGVYGALAGKQDTISDLSAIRSGAAAGATAVQPTALETALAQKQDALSSEQLDAVNSGITSADVEQITTNKNNISYIEDKSAKQLIPFPYAQGSPYTQNGITYTADDNGVIHVTGTISGGNSYYGMILTSDPKPILQDGEQYILFIHVSGTGKISQFYINEVTSGGSNSLININDLVAGDYVETINFSESENSNGISCIIKNAASNTSPIDMYLSIMICKKSDWDISHTYQPYAPTNRELYDMIRALSSTRSAKSVNLPNFEKMSAKEIAEYYGDTQYSEPMKR